MYLCVCICLCALLCWLGNYCLHVMYYWMYVYMHVLNVWNIMCIFMCTVGRSSGEGFVEEQEAQTTIPTRSYCRCCQWRLCAEIDSYLLIHVMLVVSFVDKTTTRNLITQVNSFHFNYYLNFLFQRLWHSTRFTLLLWNFWYFGKWNNRAKSEKLYVWSNHWLKINKHSTVIQWLEH